MSSPSLSVERSSRVLPHTVAALVIASVVACNAAPASPPGVTRDASVDAGVAAAVAASSGPPTVIPPPYDLEAKVQERIAGARDALGERAVTSVVAGVFVLAAPAPSRDFAAGVKLVTDAIPRLYHDRFLRSVDEAVTVFALPSDAAYRAFCVAHYGAPCDGRYGVYIHGAREAVVDLGPGIQTLTHEIVHPMVQRDFPTAPAWFDEGLGALFENPSMRSPGEIHGATNWRHGDIERALASPASRAKVRLDALFGLSDGAFRGADRSLHYAIARYACQWLDGRKGDDELWSFYRAWRDGVATDPTGERAFASVVGMTPAAASEEWVKWVATH
jgi:hypothetical protein